MCGFLWVRVDSGHSFPATWSLRWSVLCSCVCLWSFLMERQLARAAHPPCKTQNKNIASDAACAGWSNVAASASGRISQRVTNKSVEKMYSQSASFKQMCTQMPRMLLVPRVDVVRKCLRIFFLSRNRPTRRHTTTHRMCLWPKVKIRVSQIYVVVPCITGVLRRPAPSTRRKSRSSDEPTSELGKEIW